MDIFGKKNFKNLNWLPKIDGALQKLKKPAEGPLPVMTYVHIHADQN